MSLKVDRHVFPYNNVLITGSFGYIGTNLVNYLRENSDINIYHADKAKGIYAEDLAVVKNIEFIVHLAAFPGLIPCTQNFEAAVIDNVSSAFSVFKVAHKNKIPVIFTSSQAAKDPYSSFYASLKRAIEVEAARVNKVGGDIRIIRLSNVYGGEEYLEKKFTVISKFVKAVENDEPIIVNGDGSQVRDFVSVVDVCRAIALYMEKDFGYNFPIDIGSGVGTSILDIAKMFKYPYKLDEGSETVGAAESIVDPGPAKDLLGYEAQHKVEHYIDNLRQILGMR